MQHRSSRHDHENAKLCPKWHSSRSSSSLLEVPRDVDPANGLVVSQLCENDGRDVDVSRGAAGAAVGDCGQDRVAVGPVDADLLAADRALVGVCVDAVVSS